MNNKELTEAISKYTPDKPVVVFTKLHNNRFLMPVQKVFLVENIDTICLEISYPNFTKPKLDPFLDKGITETVLRKTFIELENKKIISKQEIIEVSQLQKDTVYRFFQGGNAIENTIKKIQVAIIQVLKKKKEEIEKFHEFFS